MSVELIGARVAELQQQLAAFSGQITAAPSTSFASQLASAQSSAGTTTAAGATPTPTTLGGGTATQYDAQITAAATKYGIDPALLKGLIRQESNFNAAARSSAGAQGLTQLMPGTAAGLGVTDVNDPAQAIEGGAKYLKQQLDRFGGDASKALAAYNAGPGAVSKFGGVPPYVETQNYVQKVLGYAAEYAAPATATPAGWAGAVSTTPVSATSMLASAGAETSSSSGSLDYSTV